MSGAVNAAMGTGSSGGAGGAGTSGAAPGASAPPPSGGAGGANGAGAIPPQNSGGTPSDWTTGLNEDLRGYVQNKGFKDVSAVVDSYRNFEKLIGVPQDRVIKLPTKEDDPAWGDVYERLGRPKDSKEYNIPVPKGGDEKFAEWAKGTFHELGLSKSAGEKLAGKWNEYAQNLQQSRATAYSQQTEKDVEGLRKEWGMAHDKHVSIAQQAASTFGIDGNMIDRMESAMGYSGLMKFLHKIGSGLGEGKFVSSGSGGNKFGDVMTPDAARSRIQALRNDPDFTRRYLAGEAAARAEFENLHKMSIAE